MNRRSAILLLLAVTACTGASRDRLADLRPGRFVEVKGALRLGRAEIQEIDELPRGADDKADKVELTGPVEAADAGVVTLLGQRLQLDAETTHEAADKSALPPFAPAAGDWLRVKARHKGDVLRARTLRRSEPREQFKVTGEVLAIDVDRGLLDVGGVVLPLAQDVDTALLGGRDPNDPLALFLADDQKGVPFSFALGDWRFGGGLSAGLEWNDEFDLDATDDGDRTKPEIRAKVDVLWLFDDRGSYVFGEVAGGRDETWREGGENTAEDVLELTRGLVSWAAADGLQVLVGRQDFDEEREWLYDEVLDGVRLLGRHGAIELEVGAATGRGALAEDNDYEDTGLWLGHLRWTPAADWTLGAYLLQRTDDTAAGFEPLLAGVRSLSAPRYGFGHWCELGIARGDAGAQAIEGSAVDVGVSWAMDAPLRPFVGVGYAHGDGRRDGASRTGYRQSGLQDNNGKLGGVTSVRYYGELLDPELANLGVWTAVAAIRPFAGASVSLLLHGYTQDVAAASGPDTELRTAPTGASRDLGREYDLVLGYRWDRRITLELVAAHFEPGAAFAGEHAAHLLELTARFSF